MPSITIDAGALAVPPHNVSVEDANRYVHTLLELGRLIGCPWIEVTMSEKSCLALDRDNLFPFYPQLKNLMTYTGIKHFDANTVNTVILKLLSQSLPTLEEYFGVNNVLSDNLCVSPDVLSQSMGDALRSDLSRILILTAILRKCCRKLIHSHAFFLRHAPSHVVNVRAEIYEIEHNRSDLVDIPFMPEVYEGNVLICDDFRGMIKCMDGPSILASSQDKADVETAIRIALFASRLERGEQSEWNELPVFRIGDHFLDTAVEACRKENGLPRRILRAVVETLDSLNDDDAHPLRTGPGGNNPPRLRGNDRAMRRDIDRTFHLHYWSCEDRLIEFATVSFPYSNYWIPE